MAQIKPEDDLVEKVIQILKLLPKIPHPDDDFTPIELLTWPQVNKVMEYLEKENPGIVAHIERARKPFSRGMGSDFSQAVLNLAGLIVVSSHQPVNSIG